MGKYKPQADSQGLCAAGVTDCVDYTCTDCAGDRPRLHTHTQILALVHTLAHANTDTPTRTPALTPRLIPTPLIVATGCPGGHYRTECGGLKFHGDSSDTRIQHVQSHMASQSATSCMGRSRPPGGRQHRRFTSTQARSRGQLRAAVCGGLLQKGQGEGPARALVL